MPTPGRTDVYGLRFPQIGEPIRTTRAILEDNARTIEAALLSKALAPPAAQDLAAVTGRVSALEVDTGWQNAPLVSTAGTGWSTTNVVVRRAGKVLNIVGAAAKSTWTNGEIVFTLQAQYRPTVAVELLLRMGSAYYPGFLNTNGTVQVLAANTTGTLGTSFAFVASQGILL